MFGKKRGENFEFTFFAIVTGPYCSNFFFLLIANDFFVFLQNLHITNTKLLSVVTQNGKFIFTKVEQTKSKGRFDSRKK